MSKLENRIALVTAGGSGIGHASCELFAAEGAEVIVADIDESAAEETVTAIQKAGGKARPYWVDVSDVGTLPRDVRDGRA